MDLLARRQNAQTRRDLGGLNGRDNQPDRPLRLLYFKEEFADYIRCRAQSGDEEVGARDFYVAKPHLARHADRGDTTVTTVAVDQVTASQAGYDDETWYVTPPYYEDCQIVAMQLNDGVTVTDDDKPIGLIEVSARQWGMPSE